MSTHTIGKNDARSRFSVVEAIRHLDPKREWRIEVVQNRKRRSDRQNRYYWPCFVAPLADWLCGEWGRTVDPNEAHELLKDRFLRTAVVQGDGAVVFDAGGDPLMRTRSTTELNTLEFNLYLDSCAEFLKDWCDITVPEPGEYHESEAA